MKRSGRSKEIQLEHRDINSVVREPQILLYRRGRIRIKARGTKMSRVDAQATKISRKELKILLQAYIRDQTAEQLLDRYTKEDAEQYMQLKEKLIVMIEVLDKWTKLTSFEQN